MPQTEKHQIKALIDLLGREKDGRCAALLRGELARLMKENPAALHDVIETDFRCAVPAALVSAMEEVCWEELAGHTRRFAEKINPDLEEALAVVTRFVNPAFGRAELTAELDALAARLRTPLARCVGPEQILDTMGRFFFRTQAFCVLPAARDVKEVSFGRFLQKKRGSALCLCCLYALCGQRFGLDAGVIDLAGRLLVRFNPPEGGAPLFADPLAYGNLMTEEDCRAYIHLRNLQWSRAFAAPLSSRALLRRFLGNMIFILNKLRDERRVSYLRRYMDILKD